MATHATATITTRVYVQVHNRGVVPADNVRVLLLLANASLGLPALPFGFAANVQAGTPINTADWKTVGFATLNDVRAGFPRVAAFNLTSDLLPPPASLAGNNHHCVLALIHHADDPFTATQTVTDLLSVGERKTAHKNRTVVQFTGTLPPAPPPLVLAVRLHNPSDRRQILTTLRVRRRGYRGRVRLYVPQLALAGEASQHVKGGKVGKDFDDFRTWADEHIRFLRKNRDSRTPFHEDWSKQRIADVHAALAGPFMVTLGRQDPFELKEVAMAAGGRHTVFLLLDRPATAQTGTSFPIDLEQLAAPTERVVGGMDARIEIVPATRPRGTARPAARRTSRDEPPPKGRTKRR